MPKIRIAIWALILLTAFILFCGGKKCIGVEEIPETSPTTAFSYAGVNFDCAILPDGNPVNIEVKKDDLGKSFIWFPWSGNPGQQSKRARITFTTEQFGDGLSEVQINCYHYNNCHLEAFSRNGISLATADHTLGQNALQNLILMGDKIAYVEIEGSEIGIRKICYKK